MGDFVGVDPANLRELTARLQRLHDVLARQSPAIQQKMQKWGSEVSFALLPRLIDEALNDARDMQARTSKADDLANEKGWNPIQAQPSLGPNALTLADPPVVHLDWAATGHSSYQAQQDAAQLSRILAGTAGAGGDIGSSLTPLAERLRSHLNDKEYLTGFWSSAAPLASRLAKTLYDKGAPDGPMLTQKDQAILTAFGTALAAATRLRKKSNDDAKGEVSLLPDTAIKALKAGDPWSVGMLLKYGPNGKSWDDHFLADMTRFLLDARRAGELRWPSPRQPLQTRVDADRFYGELAILDPFGATLNRAAENGKAARHVLGDPNGGLVYTRMLVGDPWHTPGYDPARFLPSYISASMAALPLQGRADESPHVAAFLKAAVSAPRGTDLDAKESAWSVINILESTSEFAKDSPEKHLPKDIRTALLFTAARYITDLAAGAGHPYGSQVVPLGNIKGNPWIVVADDAQITQLFTQALREPKEFGAFMGLMDARIATSVAANIQGSSDRDYLNEMAKLYGVVQRVRADYDFAGAMLEDEKAERYQTAISSLTGGFGAVSFSKNNGKGVKAQILTGIATPFATDALDTSHTVTTLREIDSNLRDLTTHVEIPVVRGLIDAGVLHVPPDATWFRDDRFIPDATFTAWYSQHQRTRYGEKTLQEWVDTAQNAIRSQA